MEVVLTVQPRDWQMCWLPQLEIPRLPDSSCKWYCAFGQGYAMVPECTFWRCDAAATVMSPLPYLPDRPSPFSYHATLRSG